MCSCMRSDEMPCCLGAPSPPLPTFKKGPMGPCRALWAPWGRIGHGPLRACWGAPPPKLRRRCPIWHCPASSPSISRRVNSNPRSLRSRSKPGRSRLPTGAATVQRWRPKTRPARFLRCAPGHRSMKFLCWVLYAGPLNCEHSKFCGHHFHCTFIQIKIEKIEKSARAEFIQKTHKVFHLYGDCGAEDCARKH